jgi:hypothetical protein
MSGPIEVTIVGKWSVGFSKSNGLTILSFEFADRPPINLAVQQDQAEAIAKAILAQIKTMPTEPSQMN